MATVTIYDRQLLFGIVWGILLLPSLGVSTPCRPKTSLDLSKGKPFQYHDKCSVAFDINREWTDARDFCREGGGELIKLHKEEDMDLLAASMEARCYWIGINDREIEGQWRWLDGTKTSLHTLMPADRALFFEDESDCMTVCKNPPLPIVWIKNMCTLTAFQFLCEFEALPEVETTPLLTTKTSLASITTVSEALPEVKTTPVVTTKTTLASITTDVTRVPPPTQMEENIGPIFRSKIFLKVTHLGKEPRLLSPAGKTMKIFSVFGCCSKCLARVNCVLANYNDVLKTCRLFFSKAALNQGAENDFGWELYQSAYIPV